MPVGTWFGCKGIRVLGRIFVVWQVAQSFT
jgi:hypothetical protein